MANTIQVRRDSAADWTSNDPTLAEGEIGYETDTGYFKIGDGATSWTSLGYTVTELSDTDPEPVGATASAGTSEDHSRADHVHGTIAFSVYLSENQDPYSSLDIIEFDTEDFDIGGCFDVSTYKFLPDVAGYYEISLQVSVDDADDNEIIYAAIYKNTTIYKLGVYNISPGTAKAIGSTATAIIYLNGTTDYIQGRSFETISSSVFLSSGSRATSMHGKLICTA